MAQREERLSAFLQRVLKVGGGQWGDDGGGARCVCGVKVCAAKVEMMVDELGEQPS